MSIPLENINSLFKQRFGEGPVETLRETPYFLKMTQPMTVSKSYTVPVNLMPGHSLRFSDNPYASVMYNNYRSPVIREAKGEITAKFFKVEVPIGVIDSLNKKASEEQSLAYETARYFIDDAVKTNQLLAELSYMFGPNGLPMITAKASNSATYNGETITAPKLIVEYDPQSTSEAILRLILNSRVTIGTANRVYTVVDINSTQILLEANSNANANANITPNSQMYLDTQVSISGNSVNSNDNIGLYQLMTDTGSVLGIDSTNYRNWQPGNIDLQDTPLTITKVKEAATQLITRGGVMDEDLCLFVSQETWDGLSAEIDLNRQFDSSYHSEKNMVGQRKIGIMHSNGMIEIKYHPLMKRDTAFMMTNPAKACNLITLTTGRVMDFENNKNFMSSENSTSAYAIGKMYFAPFMRDRRRHIAIDNIAVASP